MRPILFWSRLTHLVPGKLHTWLVALLLGTSLLLLLSSRGGQAEEPLPALLTGVVLDRQGQPVRDAAVRLHSGQGKNPVSEDVTQPDGRYALILPEAIPDDLEVQIQRPHFAEANFALSTTAVEALRAGTLVVLPDVILLRRLTVAFWIATVVFVGVLALIATGKLHNTL
ncbi:MAG TPA: carboxypeptidase-like regulatory domain-containing protein, partial [Anaerolineae bacterium]|nr:carboxypeptidase-like regulatory domain-containing protein [Anaerolineae bacterium]